MPHVLWQVIHSPHLSSRWVLHEFWEHNASHKYKQLIPISWPFLVILHQEMFMRDFCAYSLGARRKDYLWLKWWVSLRLKINRRDLEHREEQLPRKRETQASCGWFTDQGLYNIRQFRWPSLFSLFAIIYMWMLSWLMFQYSEMFEIFVFHRFQDCRKWSQYTRRIG